MSASPSPDFGVRSMTAPLRRVLVREPATEGDWAGAAWRTPDAAKLEAQHEAFCALLAGLGARVEVAGALDGMVDAVYMHDPLIVTQRGGLPLRMKKPARREEPSFAADQLKRLQIPVLGYVEDPGWADGGDRFWIDETTAAIGLGYRTNRAGADAIAEILAREGARVESYDMPHDKGPGSVLHLQSFISGITPELVVVFEPLAPVRLLEDLEERGIARIAISEEDYLAMGCNILAVRPGVVVVCDGAPGVRAELERRGIEVHAYDGSELSLKGDGGPTCLTCPLWRA